VTASADGLRQRLSLWAGQFTVLALDATVERMRPEAPIAPAGDTETGGSPNRGELRRSLRAGPVIGSGDRFVGQFVAPVIQAATTNYGAAPHVIRATQPHGRLVFFSRNAGRVVMVGSPRHPGEVHHPGSVGTRWIDYGLQRWWPRSLADASHQVRP
jgi:hypothetical protein